MKAPLIALLLSCVPLPLFAEPDWGMRIPNSTETTGSDRHCIHCHTRIEGGKQFVNAFGNDWFVNGRRWSGELAAFDSDGDGESNGVELGDPEGIWKVGDQPALSNFSNPGNASSTSGNSSSVGSGDGPAAGEWTLATPEISQTGWDTLSSYGKVATTINQDIVHLGSDWYWGTGDVFYYLSFLPYIYDQTNDTWFFTVEDREGVFYFNYSTNEWLWFPRDGSGGVSL